MGLHYGIDTLSQKKLGKDTLVTWAVVDQFSKSFH